MESYSGTWALLVLYALLGPIIGLFLPFVAIPIAIYGVYARQRQNGLTASWVALGLALAPLLFTVIMWYELITGLYVNGDPIDSRDEDIALYHIVAALDAAALVVATVSLAVALRRRKRPAA